MQRVLSYLSTLILSILLATLVWFVAVRQENPPIEADYSQTIPLEVQNVPDGTTIYGDVPSQVSLRLRAPQTSWDDLSPEKFRAWIDLADLTPGLHDLPVQLEVSDRAVTIVENRPSTVNIRLETLTQAEFPITIDILDSPPIGYIARTPILDPISATVKGPDSVVSQVTQVWGEVYLRGAKEAIKRSVDLSARNENGEALTRLDINPEKVEVSIPIEQRFGYRDVSVRVVVVGEVASGYWISNITVDPSTVTVVGSPSALSELPGYVNTFEVDVSGATNNITERVALRLPTGVSVVQTGAAEADNASGVQVYIDISSVEGGQTVQRPVTFQGLNDNLWAVARPSRVDVILSGPLPRLQSLTVQDVKVSVDLFGLGVGVHKLKPTIVVPESLRVESVLPDTVEIQISVVPPATPTMIPLLAPTPTITSTPTLTVAGAGGEDAGF